MSDIQDLTIPYSSLNFTSESSALLEQSLTEHEVISALLVLVVRRHAQSLIDVGTVIPVSVTVDVTGEAQPGETLKFESSVDRKTRTLVFIGGVAMQGGTRLLKATAVYRIA
ncbi:MAG: hypothetical protein L3J02_06220 [Henriciella sp.]|nr:hypothetical protein [Henriciella sp.]